MADVDKINRNLDNLIGKIEILVDAMEKGGRANRPYSMYHYSNSESNGFLRDRNSFESVGFNKVIDDFVEALRHKLESFEKELKRTEKQITKNNRSVSDNRTRLTDTQNKINSASFSTLSPDEQRKLKQERASLLEERDKLAKEQRRLARKRNNLRNKTSNLRGAVDRYDVDDVARESLWQHEHSKNIEVLRRRYRRMPKHKRDLYGSEANYVKHETDFETYKGNTSDRSEASNLIARSGFGNTAIGRFSQNIIERNQRIADMGNFANELKAGGASKIGKAMFGSGKAGAVATKALSGFGKGLSVATKALGPWAAAIGAAIDAIKTIAQTIGQAINAINAARATLYQGQAAINDITHEQNKQIQVTNINMQTEGVKYQGDMQLKMLDTQGEIMLNALKLTTDQYVKSVGIAIGPLIDGINAAAYKAAETRIDAAAQLQKNLVRQGQLETMFGRYANLRGLEYENVKKGAMLDIDLLNLQSRYKVNEEAIKQQNYENQHYIASPMAYNDEFDKAQEKYANTPSGKYRRDIRSEMEKNPDKIMGYKTGNMSIGQAIWHDLSRTWDSRTNAIISGNRLNWQPELHSQDLATAVGKAGMQLTQAVVSTNQQIADKQLEIQTEVANTLIDAAAEVKKQWIQLAEGIEKYSENFDSLTNELGINMGYTSKGQLKTFQKSMFSVVENVSSKFGKDIDEIVKMQQSYIESTGRNKILNEGDWGKMVSLGKYLGDDGLVASYASEMEIFNANVSDSVDMLDEALQDVNRMGLNGRKFTKTVVDNLKLAQKYQFKDGTKGLMRMAKWAENARFNMNSLAGMLDKISEGGLEGVITQGAQFQVLGGHAAMNADPIAMMYERYADPEAFAKRMVDMTKGYGQVDKVTGETKFSGNELMMLEQLARVQGRSVEDVQNEIRQRNKREKVVQQIGGNFSEEQKSFISNNATYNKEKGRFEVNVMGKDGKFTPKAVSELTKEDLENIMPEKHEEKMEKYMEKVVSAVESMKGEEIAEKANVAAATYEDMLNAYTERTRIAYESFAQHRDEYIEKARAGMNEITQSFQDYISIFEQGNKNVDESVKKIEGTANNISAALNQTAEIIMQANANIAAAGNISGGDFNYQGGFGETNQSDNTLAKAHNSKVKRKTGGFFDSAMRIINPSYNWGVGAYRGIKSFFKGNFKGAAKETMNMANPFSSFINDGFISNNNRPIIASASNVTKVQDGASYVKSDKKDSALFAKKGGPFDRLFNGVFGKVDSLYNMFQNMGFAQNKNSSNKSYFSKLRGSYSMALEEAMQKARIGQELMLMNDFGGYYGSNNSVSPIEDYMNNVISERSDYGGNTYQNASGGYFGNGNTMQFETLKVEISGSLELSSNGQSLNIISELRKDPILVRSLSRMLTEHISSAMNGGRGASNFAIGSV